MDFILTFFCLEDYRIVASKVKIIHGRNDFAEQKRKASSRGVQWRHGSWEPWKNGKK
jgi:hypothetical protein